MRSKITRRVALAGTAAAALTAGATLPAIGADHPDADLFALWGAYLVAQDEEQRLLAWHDRIAAEIVELNPPMPDELADLLGLPHGAKAEPAGILGDRFDDWTDAQRERYHDLSTPWRHECVAAHPHAFDDYNVAADANFDRMTAVLLEIMDTTARTPDGLLVKVDAVKAFAGDRTNDTEAWTVRQTAMDSIVASLQAMGGQAHG